jgi:hexokinase
MAALRIDGTSEQTFSDFVKQLQATTIIPVDALHLARDHFDEALAAVHEVRSGKLHENSLKEMERIVAGSCKQLFSNQFRTLTDWLCRLLLHSLPRWENED